MLEMTDAEYAEYEKVEMAKAIAELEEMEKDPTICTKGSNRCYHCAYDGFGHPHCERDPECPCVTGDI